MAGSVRGGGRKEGEQLEILKGRVCFSSYWVTGQRFEEPGGMWENVAVWMGSLLP